MHSRRRSRPVLTLVVILFSLVGVGAAFGSYLFYFRPVAEAVGSATGQVVPRPVVISTGSSAPSAQAATAPTPPSLTGTAPINVLLLGSDTDAKFDGNYNTQIMIVVSIEPAQKKVSMLSIPRDLWVPIPGQGTGKIGVAYGAGGLALARQAVETDFGIPIHYYAWVGLDGFIKVIDTLGGVDVDVSHPVVDDSYPDDVNSPDPYAYRRLYIPAGLQHLDGTRALEYVRSRHGDLIGDFGRSQRQQQVLDAIRSSTNGRDLITRLPQLASDLKDSVRTDMTLSDLLKFAAFADQIKSEPVQQYTLLPPKYSEDGTSDDGQSIVVPNWSEIRPLVDQVFGLNTAASLPMTVPQLGISSGPASQPAVAVRQPLSSFPAFVRTPIPSSEPNRIVARPTYAVTPLARSSPTTPTVTARLQASATPARVATAPIRTNVQPTPTARKETS